MTRERLDWDVLKVTQSVRKKRETNRGSSTVVRCGASVRISSPSFAAYTRDTAVSCVGSSWSTPDVAASTRSSYTDASVSPGKGADLTPPS